MQSYQTIPGAPIPAENGRQGYSFSIPPTAAVFGPGLRATEKTGEQHTLSTADEALARQAALSFFSSRHHENLTRCIEKATGRGTIASSSAADGGPVVITVTPGSGENDGLGFGANVPATSTSAAPCAGAAGPAAAIALSTAIEFPFVPAAAEHPLYPAAATLQGVPLAAAVGPADAVALYGITAAVGLPSAVTLELPATAGPSKGDHISCAARITGQPMSYSSSPVSLLATPTCVVMPIVDKQSR